MAINNEKVMKKILFVVCMVLAAVTASAVVKPGVEVLRDGGFAQLQGKRVGLVTNPSGKIGRASGRGRVEVSGGGVS